ncbi:MAG: chromosome segregation protein SMC, partial [Gammaproteobacteria bacterium]|nr:chromosome segregation protein SMC [Gammaproteobacteria bacterium]
AVKRTLSRDGHSNYFINRVKTRRKDVLDLFRGTGLGARSYSLIEQGMVSRIVEARPEDLRLFVEEAAGTSKYKDRRRETETRIAHTRENLDRVADIRDELGKQLRRLKRQAGQAKRFRELKDEERLAAGQLLMLHLRDLESKLAEHDRLSAQCENRLQAAMAAQRETETETGKLRGRQAESRETHNRIQQTCYNLGAEIANLEQRIEHLSETRQRQGEELERLKASRAELQRQLQSERAQLGQLRRQQSETAPQIEQLDRQRRQAEQRLAEAEAELDDWRAEWEAFNERAQAAARQQEVQRSRIVQLRRHLERSTDQAARLERELAASRERVAAMDIEALRAEVARHDEACERAEQEFHQTEQTIQSLSRTLQQKRDEGAKLRGQRHQAQSRLASLRQIQAAALGGDDRALQTWLADSGLESAPQLAARVRVDDGWQRAADRLLSEYLGAVCVGNLPDSVFGDPPDCAFMLVTGAPAADKPEQPDASGRTRLLDKVAADGVDLSGFLGGVYVADNLQEAMSMQASLNQGARRECVVTRDGVVVGANWVSFASRSQLDTGVLVREDEMKRLQGRLDRLKTDIAAFDDEIAQLETRHQAHRQQGERQRAALDDLRRAGTEKHARLGREEARHLEAGQRIASLDAELGSLGAHTKTDHGEIAKAEQLLQHAADQQPALESQRDALLQQKQHRQDAVAGCKDHLRRAGERFHQLELRKQRLDAELESTADSIAGLDRQLQAADAHLAEISGVLNDSGDPVGDLQGQLQQTLERRVEVERQLSAAGDAVAELDNRITDLDARRSAQAGAVLDAREHLERQNLARREVRVRRDTQAEQSDHLGYDREALLAQLPEEANIEQWERRIETLKDKINRIGAVNLVAIEEFEEQSERKQYLDRQYEDLTEALDTLRGVIGKIDRETRARFKETFERLNAGFNDFFPRLFGGGKAELRLTGEDLLTAGVVVMARPPGKRNSHIHLLSGGEKALTAVALLFSLFKLNPAPFCMLDEVDAPLDDANVERYCRTLKNLVGASQIIVITHNKITMEAADVLVGVTMGEPGVSRLVSVDVEQAVEMAAQ